MQETSKSAAMREFEQETVSGQRRYAGEIETINYIEYMMDCWSQNGIPPKMCYSLGQVLRYLSSRLGNKDDIQVELGKAHNYLWRAIHGEWYEK